MEEQPKNVLDLEKLENEKQKLIALIRPAVEMFRENTGFYPNISVVTTTMETKCGTIESGEGLRISISI